MNERIKRARVRKGLSIQDVANATGLSRVSLYALEDKTKHPKAENIQRLADLYGVRVEWLMNGIPPERADTSLSLEATELGAVFDTLRDHQKTHVRNAFAEALDMPNETPSADITPSSWLLKKAKRKQ